MSEATSIVPPSTIPTDNGVHTPVVQGEESKQSRSLFQNKEQPVSDLHKSGLHQAQNGSLEPGSLANAQGKDEDQGAQPKSPEGRERGQVVVDDPETIYSPLNLDTDLETIDSMVKGADHIVNHMSDPATKVEERKSTDVEKAEKSATTFSSQTTISQQHDVHHSVQGEVQTAPAERSLVTSSSISSTFETRSFEAVSMSVHNAVQEQFLLIENSRRKEMDHIASLMALMTTEYDEYRHSCEIRFTAYETEKTRLLRENSTLTARITLLEVKIKSRGDSHSEIPSQHEKSATIITITTTITTIIAQVEQWKHALDSSNGSFTISTKELEQLSLDLSTTSSHITELEQQYAELLKTLSSLREELKLTSSHTEEKDRTIASLTVEVDQWKRADAEKGQQIIVIRRDTEALRRDLSSSSSRTTELQQRCAKQLSELSSVRKELQVRASLIEEKDRMVASITAEVTRWKASDDKKTEQITTIRRDYEKLRRDLSAASSEISEFRTHYESQSQELSSIRDELQVHKTLVEEKERKITTLTAELDEWKRTHAASGDQIATDKVKFQEEFETLTTQNTELRERYDAQSKEMAAIRAELQAKLTLLEEKERTITSLTTEVAEAKRETSVKMEQTLAAHRDVEQLRVDLSSASSRITELQRRYESQSRELNSVRDEFHKLEILYRGGRDHTTGNPTELAISQQIELALKQKNKELEEIRQELTKSTTRSAELQASYESLSRDSRTAHDEFKAKASKSEGIIASLTVEVEKWKRAEAAKTELLATTVKQVEKLQLALSTSTTQLTELQRRYEAQSSEFIAVRKQLQTSKTSYESTNLKIASLTAEIDQWKRSDAVKVEEIATTRKQMEKLRFDLSSSTTKLTEIKSSYEAQLLELTSVRKELEEKTSLHESDVHTVESLTVEIEHWKRADATKTEQITTIMKQVDKLQLELSTSSTKLAELKGLSEAQSLELVSVRKELLIKTSSCEEKERTVITLTAQVEEWKRTSAALKEEHIVAIEALQRDLTKSSAQVVELQKSFETQSKELQEFKERTVTLASQIEELKLSYTAKVSELAIVTKQLEQLRIKSSAGGEKGQTVIIGDEQLGGKHVDGVKGEGVNGQLDVDLRKLTFDSKETKEVYERIRSEVKDYSAIIKLTTTVDEWLRADARRAEELALELAKRTKENEELRASLITLKDIHIRAPILKQIFQSRSVEIREEHMTSTTVEHHSSSVQGFAVTQTTHTDKEITEMLQKLNAEVHQSAKLISQYIVENCSRVVKPTRERISAAQQVSHYIGQPLAGCLGSDVLDEVAVYLPIAFRAYITYYLCWVISSWTIEKGYNDRIKKIYEQLQKSEAQTISGRWRSLTRAYISPTSLSDPNTLIADTMQGLSDIIVTACFAASSSAAKSSVLSKFGDKVSTIISIAGQFSKMVGETVSADFEVFVVNPVQTFEKATMEEDVDGDDKHQGSAAVEGHKVLCSTHLGMRKRMQLESGKSDTSTVIKAKVVMESLQAK